ncbi:unnamed protein product, partial [Staurois parvus]
KRGEWIFQSGSSEKLTCRSNQSYSHYIQGLVHCNVPYISLHNMHFFSPLKMWENVCASYGANIWSGRPSIPAAALEYRLALLCSRTCSSILPVPWSSSVLLPFAIFSPWCRHLQCGHPAVTACGFTAGYPLHMREKLHFVNGPVVLWDLSCVPQDSGERGGRTTPQKWERVLVKFVYLPPPSPKVCTLWSCPVLCPQSLVISCSMSTVSGHLLYYVRSLWSSPVLMSAVSGHLLYCVCSLWSSPVLCLQSLVISCTMSAVSAHFL